MNIDDIISYCISESIQDLKKPIENIKYFYHSLLRLQDLPSVCENGLQAKNFTRIFLCRDMSYNNRYTALLGIQDTPDMIKKYNIDTSSNVCLANGPIMPEDLTLIDCRIGEGFSEQFLMYKAMLERGIFSMPTDKLKNLFCNIGVQYFYEDLCLFALGEEITNKIKQTGIPMKNLTK